MDNILQNISCPADVKALDMDALEQLCAEIRGFLVEKVTKNGGHLASNLGVVELTVALHRVFSVPSDTLVWDVGHQAYVHKILTGRRAQFDTLRQLDGLSGFPKSAESPADVFDTGHSSTAISSALGYAVSRDIKGASGDVIAIVGDAAFSGGLSMEALNHIAHCHSKLIIVLNDNQMSIDSVVGGLSQYLNKIRTRSSYYTVKRETTELLSKIPILGKPSIRAVKKLKRLLKYAITPNIIFEHYGCKYLGPVDGHNIRQLCDTFLEAQKLNAPVLIHVLTKKGKGYAPAEQNPGAYHAVSPTPAKEESFSAHFGKTLVTLADANPRILAISPSTPTSSGLGAFMKKYPRRFFDTGIAEAHAVTFAAGLSKGGFIPVVSVYSSFLQRAYDSILHDVALSDLHVVFAVDRAGLVGADGETHQGIFDLSYLRHIPNLTVLAPADYQTLDEMLAYATNIHKGPIAIRYPRGHVPGLSAPSFCYKKAAVLKAGNAITLAALGRMTHTALACADILKAKGIDAEVLDLRMAKPLDFDTIFSSAAKTNCLFTLEDNTLPGGIGEAIATEGMRRGYRGKILIKAFPDKFIAQGSIEELMDIYHMDAAHIAEEAERILQQ